MRVVQLGPWPPPYGGVQTHLVALRARMDAQGIPNRVINITGAPATADPGVAYPRSAPALLRLLASTPASLLHLHLGGHLSPRLLGLTAMCTAVPGRRSVLTFHSGGYPSSPAGKSARHISLRGMILRHLDAIIVVNEEQRAMFQRFGCAAERIHLIPPHSLLADAFGAAELPIESEQFAASHDVLLVSVGLLEAEYDLGLQLAALPLLREAHGNVGLMIVGSGSLRPELERRAAASPVAPHIHFTGDLAHSATLSSIRRADALLRTTRYDGDSISVREGLAVGTPVVATRTGMRPAGCVEFEVGSLEGLADAVGTVLTLPRQQRQLTDDTENLDAVITVYRSLAEV